MAWGASKANVEQEIRHMAASIINQDRNRRAHPTYGYTKTRIRRDYERLTGMVSLYAYIDGQAMNSQGVGPRLVRFEDAETGERVHQAAEVVEGLNR